MTSNLFPAIDIRGGDRQIRLIRLLDFDGNNIFKADMQVFRLQWRKKGRENGYLAAPEYAALSYVWGNASPVGKIVFNESSSLGLRRNALEFLSSIWFKRNYHGRLFSGPDPRPLTWLWIDAICIDQQNKDEKSYQVQLMGDIYRNASKVYAWLGGHEPLRVIKRYFDPDDAWIRAPKGPDVAEFIRFRYHLLRHPYWSRLWIVQEVALAEEIVWYLGPETMGTDRLKRVLGVPRPLIKERAACVLRTRHARWDLVDLIQEIGLESLCEDPRDVVFGLLSLSRHWNITVDYNMSEEKLVNAVILEAMRKESITWLSGLHNKYHLLFKRLVGRHNMAFETSSLERLEKSFFHTDFSNYARTAVWRRCTLCDEWNGHTHHCLPTTAPTQTFLARSLTTAF